MDWRARQHEGSSSLPLHPVSCSPTRRRLTALLVTGVFLTEIGLAWEPAPRLTFTSETPIPISWPMMRIPKWSHGFLLAAQGDQTTTPVIWSVGRTRQYSVPFTIPGARSMLLYDWDRGADGTLGLSGYAVDADGRLSSYVAWVSADQSDSRVIRTLGYRPEKIALAPDGTIWTAGCEYALAPNGRLTAALVPDAGVLRHFDRSGKLLGAHIPQSSVGGSLILQSSRMGLRASRDRIAWLSVDGRYAEIAPNGRVLTNTVVSLPGDESATVLGFALSDSGDAYLGMENVATEGRAVDISSVYVLDRAAMKWIPLLRRTVADANETFGAIFGIEGSTLVIQGRGTTRFYSIGN